MSSQRIQSVIHALESARGARIVWRAAALAMLLTLLVSYDLRAYRNFASPEAMDAAQVARNLAEGRGFSTQFIRPFSLYLVQKHNQAALSATAVPAGQTVDYAKINSPHPDLANAPVYPLVLAGLMKIHEPAWPVQLTKSFWSEKGFFRRYQAEFEIAIFNQALLLVVVVLTFILAKKLFDSPVAWLAAGLTLGSDLLWKFSVSGLSTLLLLVIFLGLILCLVKVEELGRLDLPDSRRLFILAMAAGLILGVGALTRYAFGWLLVPTLIFLAVVGGQRRMGLVVAAFLAFAVVMSPWIVRNVMVSGTCFGTAGYAVAENTETSPGTWLMQSVNPSLRGIYYTDPYVKKLTQNGQAIFQNNLLHLGEGWGGMLFFAGLLLGLRNPAARRLRYFTIACLGLMVVVQALGMTQLSIITPDINSENLLVLFTPLVLIFGVAFFMTLLDQVKTEIPGARIFIICLVVAVICDPLLATVMGGNSPMVYPPYSPTEIQEVSGWMAPDELMMSDIPWAIAWYGNHTCTWTTPNAKSEYYQLNDYIKPVRGLYLSVGALNGRLLSDCMQGGSDSWGNFAVKAVATGQIPKDFPLRILPTGTLQSGMFLTDRQRW